MENIGEFVTILTGGSMQGTTQLHDYRVQEYRLPSSPSIKCNVLRESLSEDSQNIPCATLERKGVVGNLCIYFSLARYSLALILSQNTTPERSTVLPSLPLTYQLADGDLPNSSPTQR